MSELILILQESHDPEYVAIELDRAGYTVVSVPKLSVAISWLRVNDPSLIVAPVHLVDDDVFDLLRFVRRDYQLKNTKIWLNCLTPSSFTMGMRSTISSAAIAMGANAVFISDTGEAGEKFDRLAFWQSIGPLLSDEYAQQLKLEKEIETKPKQIKPDPNNISEQEISQY